MAQSNSDALTTYLEAKVRRQKERQTQPVTGGTPLSILGIIAASGGNSMPLADLQASSGMNFTSFAESIKRLRDSDYIVISGAPGSESAELTKLGNEVAALARPA